MCIHMCIYIYIIKNRACIFICVCVCGSCFDKYISIPTWPPQTKIPSSAPSYQQLVSATSRECAQWSISLHHPVGFLMLRGIPRIIDASLGRNNSWIKPVFHNLRSASIKELTLVSGKTVGRGEIIKLLAAISNHLSSLTRIDWPFPTRQTISFPITSLALIILFHALEPTTNYILLEVNFDKLSLDYIFFFFPISSLLAKFAKKIKDQ